MSDSTPPKETEKKSQMDKNVHKTEKKKSGNKAKNRKTVKGTDPGKGVSEASRETNKELQNKKPAETNASSEKEKEKTLIIEDDEVEGMTVPPKAAQPSSPWSQSTRHEARPEQTPAARAAQKPTQTPQQPAKIPAAKPTKSPKKAKSPTRLKKEESSEEQEDDDDEEDSSVKQFSFPAYKILSGASVAPVQMYPQKVVVFPSDEPGSRHWGASLTGLFQNSRLTLKLRMLRLLLIWIFFRVLNKQTAWLSDMLGIGIPDEEPPGPKEKPPPGERFIKVFREGDPNPLHVRVKRPL